MITWGAILVKRCRHYRKPTARTLVPRLAFNAGIVFGLLGVALFGGAVGYHYLDGLGWLDATLNAAMILTGMGPVDKLVSPGAKVFAILYALFGGVFFLAIVAVLLGPLAHHFLHRFHLELEEQRQSSDRRVQERRRNERGGARDGADRDPKSR